MIDKHQEADILRSLAETYQDMIEMRAIGKAGGGSVDDGGKYGEKNQAIGGGWIGKQGGIGKDKKEKNNPKADDRRAARQAAQAKADRNADRDISPSARRERAKQNKENKAKAGIDDILKDIRGK